MDNAGARLVLQRGVGLAVVIAACLLAIVLIGTDPLLGGLTTLVLLFGLGMFLWPPLGIFALIGSLVVGQLVRLPALGVEGAILPNDLVLPAVAAGWFLRGALRRRVSFPSSPLSWPFGTMAAIFILTFILGSSQLPFLTNREVFASALYIVRWLEYALLFFIVADIVRTERMGEKVIWSLLGVSFLLAILGFVQLRLFPDFRFMVPRGWDPHVGRLLSTWFDPNFLGGFLSFVIAVSTGIAVFSRGARQVVLWLLNGVLVAALVLTFSRSAYAAFLVGMTFLALLKSRRMFFLLFILSVIIVTSVPRVQERVQGVINLDETARHRLQSWANALTVHRDYPFTGIGYNTYRYVQVAYGFQKDVAEHSAGGSDSSLLTILVTTGPLGLAAYLWIIWASFSVARKAYRHGTTPLVCGLGLGAAGGLASVVVHSFFLNSLLFPHMMLTIAVVLGTIVGMSHKGQGEKAEATS